MAYARPAYKPLPRWVTIPGRVLSVYEKSLIYLVPDGLMKRKVRLPLTAVHPNGIRVDAENILMQEWISKKEKLQGMGEEKAWGLPISAFQIKM